MKFLILINVVLMTAVFTSAYYVIKDRQRLLKDSGVFSLIETFKRKSFGQRFDDSLKETGVLPIEYVFCQVAVLLMSVVIAMNSTMNILKILLLIEAAIHTGLFYKVQGFRRKLKEDLCIIQETLYYQADVGTHISDTLNYGAELIGEPMKSKIRAMAASFRLRQDVDQAINEIRKISNIHELQAFCNILTHHMQTGDTEDAHEASLATLLQLKRGELLIKRRSNRFFVQCAFGILFGSILIIMAVPTLLEAYELFNSAFRP